MESVYSVIQTKDICQCTMFKEQNKIKKKWLADQGARGHTSSFAMEIGAFPSDALRVRIFKVVINTLGAALSLPWLPIFLL